MASRPTDGGVHGIFTAPTYSGVLNITSAEVNVKRSRSIYAIRQKPQLVAAYKLVDKERHKEQTYSILNMPKQYSEHALSINVCLQALSTIHNKPPL
jgi:hypothetical protein